MVRGRIRRSVDDPELATTSEESRERKSDDGVAIGGNTCWNCSR